ncbi:MAG: hypothetical protein Q9214_004944 [Letrouitia sp. 1 TL-2023]
MDDHTGAAPPALVAPTKSDRSPDMAYTDDAVKARLSALNESQDSIVGVAQWVMFHRRHADRTATLWLEKIKDSGVNKRLNLIYVANEVAQQSKARRKDDFLIAFSPILAEAVATAYRGATNEVQEKLRRVVEVWRQRQIFEEGIQETIEKRIEELDKNRTGKRMLGGSLFSGGSGSAAPPEIAPLVPLQIAVAKANATTTTASATANTEYEKILDPNKSAPSPPVHAARLSALLKNLASAEGAVSESIKARHALIGGLEKILETNRSKLAAEEKQHAEMVERKGIIETRKREVEDSIVRGISSAEASPAGQGSPGAENGTNGNGRISASAEPDRPNVEALTPPPMESFTPTEPPTLELKPEAAVNMETGANTSGGLEQGTAGVFASAYQQSSLSPQQLYGGVANLGLPGGGTAKKRKLDDGYEGFGAGEDAMADLDEDVAELLRAESGGN